MKVSERVDEMTHVSTDKLIEKPPFPKDMKIELTSRCNFKCGFCATKDNKREQGDMDNRTFEVMINACKYLGVESVGLFLLGESFILPDLAEKVRFAKEKGIDYLYITSNGSLCTPDRIKPILEAGLNSLKISLNAGTVDTFKKVTGIDNFYKVMENIAWISKNKKDMNFCVSCVYDQDYAKELEELKEEIKQYTDDFYFLPKYNQGGHVEAPQGGNVGRMDNPVPNIPCWELFNTTRITWDGYMSICSFPHTEEYKIGSIKNLTLLNLWHHEKFVELRRKHLEKNIKDTICERCIINVH